MFLRSAYLRSIISTKYRHYGFQWETTHFITPFHNTFFWNSDRNYFIFEYSRIPGCFAPCVRAYGISVLFLSWNGELLRRILSTVALGEKSDTLCLVFLERWTRNLNKKDSRFSELNVANIWCSFLQSWSTRSFCL